jgi:short-subunit dehydrogenase
MAYWRNKVVLITGGSAGLGLAIAQAFGAEGCQLVIVARREDKLREAAHLLEALGHQVEAISADITVQADVARLFSQVREKFGRLDVLVNNAGRSDRGRVTDATPEEFQQLWEVNFLAAVRCTRAALPMLLKNDGHIVNIASLAAKFAPRFYGAYPVSKFAIAAYSQQIRLELSEEGLHVLLVCPGPLARDDAGNRYEEQTSDLPESARKAGGGAKVASIDPAKLAAKIVVATEKRRAEIVVPAKARLLAAISQLSPTLGDWILKKMSG